MKLGSKYVGIWDLNEKYSREKEPQCRGLEVGVYLGIRRQVWLLGSEVGKVARGQL